MLGDVRVHDWLPLLVTAGLFVTVVYVTATVASRDWADLLGLAYLLASPGVYAAVEALVADSPRVPTDAEVGA